jgi:antitoxin component YwqK of YwqJK toxin-antitoxin module
LLGLSNKKLGDCKKAISSFSKAVTLYPTFGSIYYYRAECYLEVGKKDSAYFDIKTALQKDTSFNFQLVADEFITSNFDKEYLEKMSLLFKEVRVKYFYNEEDKKHGEWAAYYPDSTVFREGNFKNGLKNGGEKRYYRNGQLHYIEHYENGILHGEYKSYFRNGQPSKEGKLVNGEWDGEVRGWYETGEPKYVYNMKNGIEHGLYKSWFKDGSIKLKGSYTNGSLNGEALVWNNETSGYYIEVYKGGKIVEKRKKTL